jgi:antitoxin MazE
MVDTREDDATREPVHPRAGWDEAFTRLASRGDDRLLDGDAATSSWDEEEWEWPDDS